MLDSFLQEGGDIEQLGGGSETFNAINTYLRDKVNKVVAEQWEKSLDKLEGLIVNRQYHNTLTRWIKKI